MWWCMCQPFGETYSEVGDIRFFRNSAKFLQFRTNAHSKKGSFLRCCHCNIGFRILFINQAELLLHDFGHILSCSTCNACLRCSRLWSPLRVAVLMSSYTTFRVNNGASVYSCTHENWRQAFVQLLAPLKLEVCLLIWQSAHVALELCLGKNLRICANYSSSKGIIIISPFILFTTWKFISSHPSRRYYSG